MSEMPVRHLLDSRARVPVRSELFIHRPRLADLLDRATQREITLVTGPAGTGKTLAVADWTRERRRAGSVAWLSLDRADGGARRLWRSLLSALSTGLGPDIFRDLELPDAPDIGVLYQMVRSLGTPVVLVLDDLQELDQGDSLDWLAQLLRWPPDGMRFVLISRHDPPINLHRLRLEDKLSELQFTDLAFTRAESRELLAMWGLSLGERDLSRLVDATGGWAAAIRLAALTLSTSDDAAVLLERFAGPTFLIADYLWHDVLGMLPDSYAEFLLRTSVSERLCGSLAEALSGEQNADELLRMLARDQFLAHELEGTGWYRTHTLLNKALRARLQTDHPALAREQYRKAALWFEEHEAWTEALDQAISSGDWDFAGQIVARSGAAMCLGADQSVLIGLMARIPEACAHDYPELAVGMAVAPAVRGDQPAVQRFLSLAEASLDTLSDSRRAVCVLAIRTLHAVHAYRVCDPIAMRVATDDAERILSDLSYSDAPGWAYNRGSVHALRGIAELWAGQYETAAQMLRAGLASLPPERVGHDEDIRLAGLLALAESGAGRFAEARELARRALDTARSRGRLRGGEAKWAWLAIAYVETYSCDERARDTIAQCAQVIDAHLSPFTAALLQIIQASDDFARDDLASARVRLTSVAASPAGRGRLIAAQVVELRVTVELATNDIERARSVLEEYDQAMAAAGPSSEPGPDLACTARAQLFLASNEPERVRAAVAHNLGGRDLQGAGSWLLVAMAEDRLRHDRLATEAMARVVELAADEHLEYIFRRPNRRVEMMLRRHLALAGTHREFVEKLLVRVAVEPAPVGLVQVRPLTEREEAVLIYLPTMAANAEIAAALSISENTVKQHLKSIYRKLGVRNRRDAVRVARDRGLLDLHQPPEPAGL